MIQQDLRSIQGYILGIVSVVLVLFIPFIVLIPGIFQSNPLLGAISLVIFIPFVALILGIVGLIKSSKQSTEFTKIAKILNIFAIVVGLCTVIFYTYGLIQSRGLNLI